LLHAAGWSQAAVARLRKVHRGVITHWLKRIIRVLQNDQTLRALADSARRATRSPSSEGISESWSSIGKRASVRNSD
jgi:hypothetical protein